MPQSIAIQRHHLYQLCQMYCSPRLLPRCASPNSYSYGRCCGSTGRCFKKRSDTPSLHANAIVALTIRELWLNRCRSQMENKPNIPPSVIVSKVIAAYKRRLTIEYNIHIRDERIDDFIYHYQIESICSIIYSRDCTRVLEFHI